METEPQSLQAEFDTPDPLAQSELPPLHECPKPNCDRKFSSAQGMRCHVMRVHTLAGKRGAIKGVQAATRARNLPHHKTLEYKHEAYRKQIARYNAQGLNSHGQPYKRKPGVKPQLVKNKRFQHYVYPEPGAENNSGVDFQKVAKQVTKAIVRFCPYCGVEIEKHIK